MNKNNFIKEIKELFIVQEYDGSYNVFGTYLIQRQNDMFFVSLINDPSFIPLEFSSLKYAITYCVFDKNKKTKETKRLCELDRSIGSLNVDIAQHEKMVEKRPIPDKYIYVAKLYEERLKKRKFIKEIERFTAFSKHLQTSKYKEYQEGKSSSSDKYIY